jgi:hypothetical protein
MNLKEFVSRFRENLAHGYHLIEIALAPADSANFSNCIYADDFYFIPSKSNEIRLLRKTWIIAVVRLDDITAVSGYYDGVDIQ